MKKTDIFLDNLKKIIQLKKDIFIENEDIDNQIRLFEQENGIQLPMALKLFCLYSQALIDIYNKSNIRILSVKDFKIYDHNEYGKCILFAESQVYHFGYSLDNQLVIQSSIMIVWNVYFLRDLESFILFHFAEALLQTFDNIASVKLSYAKVHDDGYSNYAASNVNMNIMCAIDHSWYSSFYESDKKILALFDYDSSSKLLLACDDKNTLIEFIGKLNYIMKKQDGYLVQNPNKYIKGKPPKWIDEKILMIYKLLYRGNPHFDRELSDSYSVIKNFFEVFGNKKDFMTSDLQLTEFNKYNDTDKYFIIARDYQNAVTWAVDLSDTKVCYTYDEINYSECELSLSNFLVYIALVQAMGLFNVNCTSDQNDFERLRPYFYELCNTANIKCYVNPQRRLLMLYEHGIISIAGKTDRSIEILVEESGVNLSYN